jgi:hypothetical protein
MEQIMYVVVTSVLKTLSVWGKIDVIEPHGGGMIKEYDSNVQIW